VIWDVDWPTVWWRSEDPERMARILRAWDGHLVHPALPRSLAGHLRAVGFEDVRTHGHSFESPHLDADSYGSALVAFIAGFVVDRQGITREEADAWTAEQRAFAEAGEYFFACTQYCFTATRA
jgi:hypothetical protein